MNSDMEIDFVVKGHSYNSPAGKPTIYKVSLKSSNGHSLILVRSDRSIFSDFPKDETVTVKIGQAQRRLDEIPEEHQE